MVYVCTSEKVDTQSPKAKITRVLGPTRENNKPRRPSYPSSFSPKTTLQFSRGCQVTSPFFSCLKVNLQRQMSHASGVFVLHDATHHKMLKVLAKKRNEILLYLFLPRSPFNAKSWRARQVVQNVMYIKISFYTLYLCSAFL